MVDIKYMKQIHFAHALIYLSSIGTRKKSSGKKNCKCSVRQLFMCEARKVFFSSLIC